VALSAPPPVRRGLVVERLSFGEVKVVRESMRLRMGFGVRVDVVLGMGLEWSEAVVCCRDAIVGDDRGRRRRRRVREEISVVWLVK